MKFFVSFLTLFFIFIWFPIQNSCKIMKRARECKVEEYPSLVAIVNTFGPFCAGTIFDKLHVITAARCIERFGSKGTISIIAGDIRVGSQASDSRQRANIRKTVIHPKYDSETEKNSIAILTLAKPLKLDTGTTSAAQVSSQSPEIDSKAIVAGWESIMKSSPWRSICFDTDVTVLAKEKCTTNLAKRYAPILGQSITAENATSRRLHITPDETQICAGDTTGSSGPYVGDYGGPLYAKNARNQMEFVGIASYFSIEGFIKGVYLDVSYYKKWIIDEILKPDGEPLANECSKSNKIQLFILPNLILRLKGTMSCLSSMVTLMALITLCAILTCTPLVF